MFSVALLKPSQNKKGRKIFQLAAEKKDSKNGAARKFFGTYYFDPTLCIVKGRSLIIIATFYLTGIQS